MAENETINQALPIILAVDDSRLIRVAIRKILCESYQIVEAADGEIAWTHLMENPHIQLVLCDLNMPVLDGLGLLERMRQSEEPRLQSLPIVIITGADDEDGTKQMVLEKGACDFISKPFNSVELQSRTKACLQLKNTADKLDQTSQKLQLESTVDELSGLGSLRYFEKVVEEVLAQIKRHGGFCVLMNLEIKGFKNIFIKYGKEKANDIIAEIGKKLSSIIRGEDKVARISLSEFSILLVSTDFEGAKVFAERIQKEINSVLVVANNKPIPILSSIGLYEAVIDSSSTYLHLQQQVKSCLMTAMQNGDKNIVAKTEIPELVVDNVAESTTQSESVVETELSVQQALALLHEGDCKTIKHAKNTLLLQLIPLLSLIITDNGMLKKMIALLNNKAD